MQPGTLWFGSKRAAGISWVLWHGACYSQAPGDMYATGSNSDVASRQTASLAARVPSTDDKLGRTQGVVRHGRVPLSER